MKGFKQNEKIELKVGNSITVKRKLGEGGQGIVYLVEMNGKQYALKWYTHDCSKDFYNNLDNNIKNGAPTASFLWPQFLTVWKEKRFGYIMALRPDEYKDFSHFLLAKVRFGSLSAMTNAALQISNAFRELHRKGYSYQDLNDGNFFIHPTTGEVLICDNDNVAPYGKNLGIAGKCRYMAPEVVLRKSLPNADTDRFSLGILLFMLLFNNHPLEGKLIAGVPCMTDQMERRFYGSSPVFIFDPTNDTNRPVMGIHTNAIRRWPIFPQFIKDAFIHIFGAEGIHEPNKRNPENEWLKLFVRLRNETVKCSCGGETFINIDASESTCINCGKKLGKPLTLNVGRNRIVMFPGQKTYSIHTKSGSEDFSTITGEVIQNKNNPALWGIRNLSTDSWMCTMPDGTQKTILTNEVVPVFKDINLVFASGLKGEIVE
ncbi:MAG: serine/threonine-protein kinase [Paludibacter sp.]|nr:serine/threonine-protein kinase [Paludibacter sp.]